MFNSQLLSQWLETDGFNYKPVNYAAISIDSRCLPPNSLFIALKGPRFDGHQFCAEAFRKGAVGFVVDAPQPNIPKDLQFVVPNTLEAFHQLAALYRSKCKQTNQLIAITGSTGKTTSRCLLAHILNAWRPTTSTDKNNNNTIGVPLQIFKARPHHVFSVVECGTNHFGELALISKMTQPNQIIITNTSDSHTEFLKDHDGVIKEKSQLCSHIQPNGILITAYADQGQSYWQANYSHLKQITFGIDDRADFYATDIHLNTLGCASFTCHSPDHEPFLIKLALPGAHQVHNALAVIASARLYGCPLPIIQNQLMQIKSIPRKLQAIGGPKQSILIDDSYNANPASTKAALDHIKQLPQTRKIMVFADMLELGENSAQLHADIGCYANQAHIDYLFTFGNQARNALNTFKYNGQHFTEANMLIEQLLDLLNHDTVVLFKGSNSMNLDKLIQDTIEAPL